MMRFNKYKDIYKTNIMLTLFFKMLYIKYVLLVFTKFLFTFELKQENIINQIRGTSEKNSNLH